MLLPALLALTAAALFTGAAVYISIAEHPARLGLSDAAALAQWGPSYHRATFMQAGLALLGGALGIWAWLELADPLLLLGTVLILAPVPFTLLAIMPTNKRLEAIAPDLAGPESRALLLRWGNLHWVRNAFGAASVAAFLVALA